MFAEMKILQFEFWKVSFSMKKKKSLTEMLWFFIPLNHITAHLEALENPFFFFFDME